MIAYPYNEAKQTVLSICNNAAAGKYTSRKLFFSMLDENQHIAVQGYNWQGTVHYWNAASTDLYRYKEKEALGNNLFELILPKEFQQLAKDMIAVADKTGRLPKPGPCDLVQSSGSLVAVYSGHIMFQWENAPAAEFFCIDLPIEEKKTD